METNIELKLSKEADNFYSLQIGENLGVHIQVDLGIEHIADALETAADALRAISNKG